MHRCSSWVLILCFIPYTHGPFGFYSPWTLWHCTLCSIPPDLPLIFDLDPVPPLSRKNPEPPLSRKTLWPPYYLVPKYSPVMSICYLLFSSLLFYSHFPLVYFPQFPVPCSTCPCMPCTLPVLRCKHSLKRGYCHESSDSSFPFLTPVYTMLPCHHIHHQLPDIPSVLSIISFHQYFPSFLTISSFLIFCTSDLPCFLIFWWTAYSIAIQ